jgi:Family of unknown function (DUF6293)
LIQIALLGKTPIVVEHGLRKSIPSKLYILHTEDQSDYQYEYEANKLKEKIASQYNIPVELLKVGAFDMEGTIKAILGIIIKARQLDPHLAKKDFAINITGGTKLMVSAASTAAYLAGSRLYYVMESTRYRGEDPVKELPLPARPENDNKGKTSKTTAIILQKIQKLGRCNHLMLTEEVRKDKRLKKNQRIQYHLDKLREREIITITLGWEYVRSGKSKIDYKKKTIQLSATGQYYAEYPELIGDII